MASRETSPVNPRFSRRRGLRGKCIRQCDKGKTVLSLALRCNLLFQHRSPLMGDQKVVHVVGMLFLDPQDGFDHYPGTGIVIAEIADQFAVMIDRDAFGNQVFADQFHQIAALRILRGRSGGEPFRVEIRLAAKLVDALGNLLRMSPFVLGMLGELRLHAFAGQAVGGNSVLGVAQHADQLRRQDRLQDVDGFLDVAAIIGAQRPLLQMLARAITQSLDVRQERFFAGHESLLRSAALTAGQRKRSRSQMEIGVSDTMQPPSTEISVGTRSSSSGTVSMLSRQRDGVVPEEMSVSMSMPSAWAMCGTDSITPSSQAADNR